MGRSKDKIKSTGILIKVDKKFQILLSKKYIWVMRLKQLSWNESVKDYFGCN